MAKNTQYTADDIEDLSEREHVRLRTQIMLGSMHPTTYQIPVFTGTELNVTEVEFIPAVYKAIGEIIDNSIDEFSQITSKNKLLKLDARPSEGWYSIQDNGRGIPIEQKKDRQGKMTWVPEMVLSRLRSGRNFKGDKEVGVIGQNGVGAACTNFCSTQFDVTVQRDGQKYQQTFSDGVKKASKPKITSTASKQTGTTIEFTLDGTVFQNTSLPDSLIRNRAIEIAFTNPDIAVEYNGEKFRYKRGLTDVISNIAGDKTVASFTIASDNVEGEFHIILDAHTDVDERIYTWVNSSLLFDGGKCNTQLMNALTSHVVDHLDKAAKRAKITLTKNDVRRGLLVLANLKIRNPEYDSQAKTRLTGPDLRVDFVNVISEQWKANVRKLTPWMDEIIERAARSQTSQRDKNAINEHEKARKSRRPVPGLLDATNSDRSKCMILITEGDSARGQISMSRDPATTAAFALTGKINNVYGKRPSEILAMGKLTDLLRAIGLTPGKRALRSELNYGAGIVIATDADYDGDNIFTLLVNVFYLWPELFDPKYPPIIYRMVAPNVCLVKGDKRIHFTRRSDYEKVKDKYKGYDVNYYKGLGSMSKTDWDMCLADPSSTFIPIIDNGNMPATLKLLFSEDADARKHWLSGGVNE